MNTKPSLYDLLETGMKAELGSHVFKRDEIIRFASQYDPQRFHLSDEGAQNSHFGQLCASGWHTLSIWMQLNVKNGLSEFIRLTGYHGPAPVFGPSPGLRNIRWCLPVYVGDTIHYTSTLMEKRPTPKRPGWAMLFDHTQCHNQNGQLVAEMNGAVTMRMD